MTPNSDSSSSENSTPTPSPTKGLWYPSSGYATSRTQQLLQEQEAQEPNTATDYLTDIPKGAVQGFYAGTAAVVGLAARVSGAREDVIDQIAAVPDEASPTKTWVGGLSAGAAQFGVGMMLGGPMVGAAAKAAGVAKTGLAGWGTRLAKEGLAGFIAFDEKTGRLSDLASGTPIIDNELTHPIIEFLKSDPDDPWVVSRLKGSLENIGVGQAFEGILKGLTRVAKGSGPKVLSLEELMKNPIAQAKAEEIANASHGNITPEDAHGPVYLAYSYGQKNLKDGVATLDRFQFVAGDREAMVKAVKEQPLTQEAIAVPDAPLTGEPTVKPAVEPPVQPPVEPTATPPVDPAAQQTIKGMTEFVSDHKALITLFETADVSTVIHEMSHVFRRWGLPESTYSTVAKMFGVDESKGWSRKQEEQFARSFEKYVYDGATSDVKLQPAFKQMKDMMRKVYADLTDSPIAVNVTKELREGFDNIFHGGKIEPLTIDTKGEIKLSQAGPLSDKGRKSLVDEIVRNMTARGLPVEKAFEEATKVLHVNTGTINAGSDVIAVHETFRGVLEEAYKQVYGGPMKLEDIKAWGVRRAESLGMSESTLKALETTFQKTGELPVELVAFDMHRIHVASTIAKTIADLDLNPKSIFLKRKLAGEIAYMNRLMPLNAAVQRNVARGVTAKRITKEAVEGDPRLNRVNGNLARVEKDILDGLMNESGPVANRQLMNAFAAANGEPRVLETILADLNRKLAKGSSKAFDIHNEIWINGLLSGPQTQATNLMSNLWMTAIQPAEIMLGGALKADVPTMKAGAAAYYNLARSSLDFLFAADSTLSFKDSSLGKAWEVWKSETPILDGLVNGEKNRGKAIAMNGDGLLAGSVNLLGKMVRIPSRLGMSADEFFKQINHRAYTRANAIQAAEKQSLTGNDFVQWVNDYVKDSVSDAGFSRDPDALLMSQRATFQRPLEGNWAKIEDFKDSSRVMQLIVPFLKTPVNIMATSVQYTPVLNFLSKQLRDDLRSSNPILTAAAKGRIAMGALAVIPIIGLAASGMITGGGPRNREARKAWIEAGNQPYSFKVGDTFIGFNRLEPVATLIGLIADYHDAREHLSETESQNVAEAIHTAVTKNVTSKTFLQGLAQVYKAVSDEDPEKKGLGAWARQRAGSYVPNVLNQSNDDDAMREVRTMMDALYARTPGLSDNLDPRRDIFGRPVFKFSSGEASTPGEWVMNTFSPVRFADLKNRPVERELAALAYPFPKPDKVWRGVDLTVVLDKQGRNAFDRMQDSLQTEVKLGGKTLYERIEELVKSPSYNSLPQPRRFADSENGRVIAIQRVVSAYRQSAVAKMVKEFPQVVGEVVREKKETTDQRRPTKSLAAALTK